MKKVIGYILVVCVALSMTVQLNLATVNAKQSAIFGTPNCLMDDTERLCTNNGCQNIADYFRADSNYNIFTTIGVLAQ